MALWIKISLHSLFQTAERQLALLLWLSKLIYNVDWQDRHPVHVCLFTLLGLVPSLERSAPVSPLDVFPRAWHTTSRTTLPPRCVFFGHAPMCVLPDSRPTLRFKVETLATVWSKFWCSPHNNGHCWPPASQSSYYRHLLPHHCQLLLVEYSLTLEQGTPHPGSPHLLELKTILLWYIYMYMDNIKNPLTRGFTSDLESFELTA